MTTRFLHGDDVALIHGDCLEALKLLPDASIDSVVTDPPYELGFMGKSWDGTGVAYRVETWAEAFRVLKPGGYLLSFGGTRTYHRMVCAIEDAGFEIRDSIHWIYGSGFPKSLDVSKAIDKAGGRSSMHLSRRQDLARAIRERREAAHMTRADLAALFPQYASVTANWERLDDGFRIPSEDAYAVLVDRIGLSAEWRAEVRAEDLRRAVGTAKDRRNDGTVIGLGHSGVLTEATTDAARQWSGWGTALKPAHEPIVVARKPLVGTVAKNVLEHGTGALNIDGCRVATTDNLNGGAYAKTGTERNDGWGMQRAGAGEFNQPEGRWPPNILLTHSEDCDSYQCIDPSCPDAGTYHDHPDKPVCPEDCPVAEMDRQSDGASRFFPVFRYQAKASRKEREAGCEGLPAKAGHEAVDREEGTAGVQNPRAGAGRTAKEVRNHHPTVKSVDLMAWLVKLVTPPGGIVLDPFMGSGTTGIAAVREGFKFVGIEREEEYLNIAEARIFHQKPETTSDRIAATGH